MRYSHNIRLIRKRKHVFKISAVFSIFILVLIGVLGFTTLNAQEFFFGFLQSLTRIVIAYFIVLFISIVTVLFVTSTAFLESLFVPILDALQSFPSFAIFPLLIVLFGKSSIDVIIILVLEMIWPLIFTILSAQKQIRTDVSEAAKVFGANNFKYLIYVLFPLLYPSIITGSIIAWGEAWETIIAAEIIANVSGVGNYLSTAGANNQTNILIIGILSLLLILFLINKYLWLSLLNASAKYQQE